MSQNFEIWGGVFVLGNFEIQGAGVLLCRKILKFRVGGCFYLPNSGHFEPKEQVNCYFSGWLPLRFFCHAILGGVFVSQNFEIWGGAFVS